MKKIFIIFALVASTSAIAAEKKGSQKRDLASPPRPPMVVSAESIITALSAEELTDRLGLQSQIVSITIDKRGKIEITTSNGCKSKVEVHVAMSPSDESKVISFGPCQ